jgi:hypothetical protein
MHCVQNTYCVLKTTWDTFTHITDWILKLNYFLR